MRIDQQLGSRWGTVFGRYTQTDWTNIALGTVTELGDVFFVQKTRNWQVSHSMPISSNLVNQFRIGYVGARADQHGATAPQADIDAVGLTGVFTDLSDDQRTYPAIGFGGTGTGLAGAGSAVNDYQASYQPMWDVSNTTTTIRGRHTLNFGANYRQVVAPEGSGERFPRPVHVQRVLHRQRRRRHAARVLFGRQRLPAGGLQRGGPIRQSAPVQFPVFRAVRAG